MTEKLLTVTIKNLETISSLKFQVTKFGDPNGIIRFDSPAQTVREVEEPDGPGTLVLKFPVIRRQDTGTVGNITVSSLGPVYGKTNSVVSEQVRHKPSVTNSRAKPQKLRRWKSMLIHQGWFTALYT